MTPRKIISLLLALLLVLGLWIGMVVRSQTITDPAQWGETMGTSYSIKISGKIRKSELNQLHRKLTARLKQINKQMSTWDEQSEISRFNHSRSLEPFSCSAEFAEVVRRALLLSEKTGGAFDPTLQPLLNLWGFGSEGEERHIPSDDAIDAVRQTTGWRLLQVEGPRRLRKSEPELSLALGGIAKGYGVDAVAELMEQAGLENWFVEIGGEVVVHGLNPDGVPWKVGIQYPTTNPMDTRIQGIVHLTGGAVASSGNYRNYIRADGQLFSHILDPRTGRALHTNVAGVTVTAPNCTDADGIATALCVMGPEEGLAWVEKQSNVEAMFLIRDPDGEITEKFSSGFVKATRYTSEN